jgi:2,4-didehydro-3-deoxy-L-rhamnonate hydrolase
MWLYTFEINRQQRVGAQRAGQLVVLPFASMLDLIRAGSAGLAQAKAVLKQPRAKTYPIHKTKLLAPLPRPGKMLFSGLNYKSHVEENPGAKFLDDPRFFAKLPNCVIGPNAPILHPGEKYQVDYEVELGVVIGKKAFHLTQAQVLKHVFGYTILHDISARYIQFKDNNETMGKNFDTFAPMGPCIVTKDEIPEPEKLHLQLKLNGQVMQDRTNADWCFPLPRLLSWLTSAMTLEPGDIVTTGTPAGVGFFRNPQVFLKPGDVCELQISKIGTLVNRVKAIKE